MHHVVLLVRPHNQIMFHFMYSILSLNRLWDCSFLPVVSPNIGKHIIRNSHFMSEGPCLVVVAMVLLILKIEGITRRIKQDSPNIVFRCVVGVMGDFQWKDLV
jgi:hypothetical protein